MIKILSIELTNKCSKACSFCYNASNANATALWNKDDLINFVNDCVENGVEVISFGGGEPLEYEHLTEILEKIKGVKTLTTNGLLLTDDLVSTFKRTLSKVQISIHFPSDVDRVINQVLWLKREGVLCGANLLVKASQADSWIKVSKRLQDLNIDVIYLPMRAFAGEEPEPEQVYNLVSKPFESVYCLTGCAKSDRFASVDFNHRVGWCSYTSERKEVSPLTFKGLENALKNLSLIYCGESSRLSSLRVKEKEKKKETKVKRLFMAPLPVATGHSQDTAWFALDACGHLANFWSSESGVVPEGYTDKHVFDDLRDESEALVTTSNVKEFFDTLDLFNHINFERSTPHTMILRATRTVTAILIPLFLTNQLLGGFFNGMAFIQFKSPEQTPLAISLHKYCITCSGFPWSISSLVKSGIFKYVHPHWNAEAYPYRRVFIPREPVIVSLPSLLPRFDKFCFKRKKKIQPALYLPYSSYDPDDSDTIKNERTDVDSGIIL